LLKDYILVDTSAWYALFDEDEGPNPFLGELASGLGELSGVVVGAIFFL